MPEEIYGERYSFLDRDSVLTFEEIARVARILVSLGVTKIRLTGGEPLVRNQVDRLVSMLSEIDGLNDLAMTSNGYLLAQMAQKLKDAGLQRITVSLDSLDEDIFKQMNGRGFGTQRVIEGIAAAHEAGLAPIKINSVVQRGVNEHVVVDLARFAKERGYIVRFIEY
ncbi:MAG TPA: GTP 3',8-cyclase MoaA, partial [Dehalococcoidia bacterium]|nr:GTP 3',8-cyclase MoaA [Dehalococcoidia bacterium]